MQKTRRKVTRRRVLSIMLSVALLVSMMPLSGGQVAKAADGYPVTYTVKQDSEGNDYISITGMASNYTEFISDGTLTLPSEIEGKPVKEVDKMAMPEISEVKELVIPASINTFLEDSCLSIHGVQKVYFMCQGIFDSRTDFGAVYFDDESLTDIYFYPADSTGVPGTILSNLVDWNYKITIHVSTQVMFDKFSEDVDSKRLIDAGKLNIVKDLEASAEGVLVAKRSALARKVVQGEKVTPEENYTKGSWAALQAAIAQAKAIDESSDENAVDAATTALDAAMEGMVSLTALKADIAKAEELKGEEYTASSWASFQEAIASAKAVPDDATAEKVEELRTALTQAQKNLRRKGSAGLKLSWPVENNSGPIMPVPKTSHSGNGEVTIGYYKDEACNTPAVGDDATKKPTQVGTYYVRATITAYGDYTAGTSNVLTFTITERQVNWNGYQWSAESGELTITGDMPEFPNILEVPWYEDMENITAVKIKEGVALTRISAYAFQGAKNLQAFPIPSTVKAVGQNAFNGCSKLEATIALTDVTVGENAFNGCSKLQGSVSLADTMTEVPAYSLASTGIGSVSIPEGVTAIRSMAFYKAKAMGSGGMVLPSTVRTIESNSFCDTGLTSITLPEGLESIGTAAFSGCASLEGITLPASLRELGERAFNNTGLKQIVIPATVQTIGGGLFAGSSSLYYVEILGTGYDTETLRSSKIMVAGGGECDRMFEGTSPDLIVLCDGTTYDTLAGYAGTGVSGNGSTYGWPATVLHKSQELLAEYQAAQVAASALERGDYTEEVWNSLQAAIAEAEAMLVDGPTNYEIAMSHLAAQKKIAGGVMACLQDALDQTKVFLAGENIEKDYDQESDSWWALQDAMEDVTKFIEENTADTAEIIAQIQVLKTARNGLVPRNTDTAKDALDTAITEAKALAEADYTAESWKALQDAIAEAEALKASGTISQIEAAQKKVEDAKNALVKKDNSGTQATAKPTGDPNGGTGTKPTEDPNGGTGAKPTTNPNGGTGVKPTAKPTAKPQAPKVKKATVKKAKSTKKKTIQVQWKKLSGVTGYQVQTALDKKFKKGKKTCTVKKAKTTKKTIKKLKSKKKYFVRVRAYKTVNGKKYYGSWSKAKSVKVK